MQESQEDKRTQDEAEKRSELAWTGTRESGAGVRAEVLIEQIRSMIRARRNELATKRRPTGQFE